MTTIAEALLKDAPKAKPKPDAPTEKWYRLTSPTGPAALEEATVRDGKVIARREVAERNLRVIVLERMCDLLDGSEAA